MLFVRTPADSAAPLAPEAADTPEAPAHREPMRYPVFSTSRDLRIDLLRGLVMVVLVVVHFDFYSGFHLLTWERIGVVSGGEGFVILSGLVVGMVYGRRAKQGRWRELVAKLWGRAAQLYKINLAVIAGVALVAWSGVMDASYVMEYVDRGSGTVYPLFPSADAPWWIWVSQALRLQIGPHQFQIMGLYVVLLLATPLALWAMQEGKTRVVLAISIALYFINWAEPARPTGAQFEYAFPLLTWQLIYVAGMAVGFHRQRLADVMARGWKTPVVALASVAALLFFAWAQNSPRLPEGTFLSFVDADLYHRIYGLYFQKNTLGLLRLLNYAVLLIAGYALMTRFWRPIHRTAGRFLIPLGQASLYVFIVHIPLLIVWTNVPGLATESFVGNTLSHVLVLGLLWAMVKKEVLFRFIPR
ncbi:MAG: OpgC domain-containing protein [Bacteroidota bacterium]